MKNRKRLGLLVFVSFLGCVPAADSVIKDAQSSLKLALEPSTAISVSDALGKVAKEKEMDSVLLIRAKVGSGKGETFDTSAAEFLVSEIPEGEHAGDTSHDPDNCPFCRAREAKQPTIVVRLLDKKGEVYPRSADKILPLKKGQHVLIRGKGVFDTDLNYFTIDADGISLIN